MMMMKPYRSRSQLLAFLYFTAVWRCCFSLDETNIDESIGSVSGPKIELSIVKIPPPEYAATTAGSMGSGSLLRATHIEQQQQQPRDLQDIPICRIGFDPRRRRGRCIDPPSDYPTSLDEYPTCHSGFDPRRAFGLCFDPPTASPGPSTATSYPTGPSDLPDCHHGFDPRRLVGLCYDAPTASPAPSGFHEIPDCLGPLDPRRDIGLCVDYPTMSPAPSGPGGNMLPPCFGPYDPRRDVGGCMDYPTVSPAPLSACLGPYDPRRNQGLCYDAPTASPAPSGPYGDISQCHDGFDARRYVGLCYDSPTASPAPSTETKSPIALPLCRPIDPRRPFGLCIEPSDQPTTTNYPTSIGGGGSDNPLPVCRDGWDPRRRFGRCTDTGGNGAASQVPYTRSPYCRDGFDPRRITGRCIDPSMSPSAATGAMPGPGTVSDGSGGMTTTTNPMMSTMIGQPSMSPKVVTEETIQPVLSGDVVTSDSNVGGNETSNGSNRNANPSAATDTAASHATSLWKVWTMQNGYWLFSLATSYVVGVWMIHY